MFIGLGLSVAAPVKGGGINVLSGDYYVDFTSMADGAPGAAVTGQPTSRDTTSVDTARVTAVVASGALTAPASGSGQSAAYSGVELPDDIEWAYVDYSYGKTDDVFALIATSKVSLPLVLATSLHIVFNRSAWSAQYFANSGTIVTETGGTYDAIALDTPVRAGWRITSDFKLELLLPNGTRTTVDVPNTVAHRNHALIYEHLNPSGAPGIKIFKAYAKCFDDPIAAGWTNLFTSPTDFSDAAWTKALVSLSAGSPIDGAASQRMLETAATGIHSLSQTLTKAASAKRYSLSYRIRGVNRDAVFIGLGGGFANLAQYFGLSTGTIPASSGSFPDKAAMVYDFGDGTYQVQEDFKSGTETSFAVLLAIATAPASGNVNYAGNVNNGIEIADAWLYERPL